MALRTKLGTANSSPTNISLVCSVEMVSKTPFKTVNGEPLCVWQYRISISIGNAVPSLEGHPIVSSGRVALVFSSRIDIKRPDLYPECAAVQDTSLLRPPNADKQYVFKTVQVGALSSSSIDIFLLATCQEDSFTPIRLAGAMAEGGTWMDVPFRVEPQSDICTTQVIRGPAIVCLGLPQPEPPPVPVPGPPLPPQPSPTPAPPPTPTPGPQPCPAPSPPPSPVPPPAPSTAGGVLSGASRRIPKATYVPLKVDVNLPDTGAALAKNNFVMGLSLQPGEVSAVTERMTASENSLDVSAMQVLQSFEGSPMPSLLPPPAALAAIPTSTLRDFGKTLSTLRRENLAMAGGANVTMVMPSADQIMSYNAAIGTVNAFELYVGGTQFGWLNLERLVMTPVGIERGELIATIPLAPLEQTAVVHKEWSVTTKEFTSIVTDSLENYSETGVTENNELAQSTTSQVSHSNQFNVNGTVSGTYGPVTATVASAFTSQDQESSNATESSKHAISTTRKASARVKQEHKVTISTTTVTGTSETSTRILQNPSPTNPMRIDYFSLMRKWHVGLYRYGLRMTYDIAIPEPGASMRRIFACLDNLRKQIGPFKFDITPEKIAQMTYEDLQKLAAAKGAVLPPPIKSLPPIRKNDNPPAGNDWHFAKLDFEVPPDYQISNIHLFADLGTLKGAGGVIIVVEGTTPLFRRDLPNGGAVSEDLPNFLKGAIGPQTVFFNLIDVGPAFLEIEASIEPTADSIQRWRNDVWNALYNAAQTQYYATQQDIQAQIAALEDKISKVDTLTLRREENEEIMKGVLRWLLGPTFDFMPAEILKSFTDQNLFDMAHGLVAEPAWDATLQRQEFPVATKSWLPTVNFFGEMVKFVNEAIEWENVLYFLYSYFWDVPASWQFIQQINHPDSTRQAFLRAGSARVVLTVRRGWEEAWVRFVEAGQYGIVPLPDDHPYLSLAKEIQLYDQTNYPGIPPANPAGGPLPDDAESAATVSKDLLAPSNGQPVTITVKSNVGFSVGNTAIIDSWDSKSDPKNPKSPTLQEAQTIVAIPDGDTTHITVERIDNPHDGTKTPFPIMQGGEKGQLIAEWFEYTPSSGTDIAVTSNLTTIA